MKLLLIIGLSWLGITLFIDALVFIFDNFMPYWKLDKRKLSLFGRVMLIVWNVIICPWFYVGYLYIGLIYKPQRYYPLDTSSHAFKYINIETGEYADDDELTFRDQIVDFCPARYIDRI